MLFEKKEWKPSADIRKASQDEVELFMKYCPTAKPNHEIYVTEGFIDQLIYAKPAAAEASGTALGAGQVTVGNISTAAHIKMLQFKIDFKNGYKNIIPGQCVLYTRDKNLFVEVEPNTPCKLLWIKKRKGYEFRYAIPEGVTHNTPIIWCRMCAKEMRAEDLDDSQICLFCGKPVNGSIKNLFR